MVTDGPPFERGTMKSLERLAVCVLTDVHTQCATTPLRDRKTLLRRVEHEGISFLTITLPTFEKGLTRSLDLKKAAPDLFPGFHTRKGQSLPAFLQGLTELVFDLKSGHILPNPSISAIWGIRQFCLCLKKVKIDCTPERVSAALRRFEECDAEVVTLRELRGQSLFGLFERTCWVLCSEVFGRFERSGFGPPRHGPGATAEGVRGNSKYSVKSWWRNLDKVLPADSYVFTSCEHIMDQQSGIESVVGINKQSPPVRVVTVPKTLTTPRVIAIEPVAMQYAQQSVSNSMVDSIESHDLTSGVVNFTNQEVNREKALTSSSDGVYATLDLSEASDRVSASLVSRGFRATPYLRRVLFGTRSATACLTGQFPYGAYASSGDGHCGIRSRPSVVREDPDVTRDREPSRDLRTRRFARLRRPYAESNRSSQQGRSCGFGKPDDSGIPIRLRKFAAMGSALCFPVESFIFYAVGMSAILDRRSLQPTSRNLYKLKGLLYVYGDDIIVHRDEVAVVADALEAFGLKVNASKSFRNGKFRESCGMDAFDGHDVTPTYVRSVPPSNKRSSKELISWISTANDFYSQGMWKSCTYMRNHVEAILGVLPSVLDTSPLLGWRSFDKSQTVMRWSTELHRFETRGYIASSPKVRNPIDGYSALLKCLITSYVREDGHLQRDVRSGTVTLKRRWTTPN